MADVLKAIIAHSCWHRCKDKLRRRFSRCVILIAGRISAGWDSSTFLRTAWQWTSKWSRRLLEQHRELHTPHTSVEVFVFSPATWRVLPGERQSAGICRQSFSCDSYWALHWHQQHATEKPAQRQRVPLHLGQEILAHDYMFERATTINWKKIWTLNTAIFLSLPSWSSLDYLPRLTLY